MMSKTKNIALGLMLLGAVNSVVAAECKSAKEIHEKKMEKYELPELPSLLSDCGIGGILGGWLDLGSLNIDLDNLFCGYGANDLGNMYGGSGGNINLPDEINLDGQIGVDVGWGSGADDGVLGAGTESPTVDIIRGAESVTNVEVESINFDELFPSNIKEETDDGNN
jgi:hypothetical protein